jgi:hypothetical protein
MVLFGCDTLPYPFILLLFNAIMSKNKHLLTFTETVVADE